MPIASASRTAVSPRTLIRLVNLPPGEDTLYAAWPILLYYGFAGIVGLTAEAAPSPYTPPEDNAGDNSLRPTSMPWPGYSTSC